MTVTKALFHLLDQFSGFIVEIKEMNFSMDAGAKKPHFRYSENSNSIESENLTIQDVKTFTVEETEEEFEGAKYITVTFSDNTDVRLFCI